MTITTLNTFQAGTLASPTPVNQNFETLRVAVNTIEQTVTNNRTYLDNKLSEVNTNISNTGISSKTAGTLFCVNNGPFDENEIPKILDITGLVLSFNTPFSATNVEGNTVNVTSLDDISLSGYENGTYNVFVDLEGEITILKNTVYRQANKPSNTLNTVWLNTSKNPLSAKIYTSNGWTNFLKIPVGSFVVESGAVTGFATNPYNQNGYNLTSESVFLMPDYTKGVNKSNGVIYTAETNGWIYAYFNQLGGVAASSLKIDGVSMTVSSINFLNVYYGTGNAVFFPIAKGSVYKGTSLSSLIFFPSKTM